MASTIAEMAGLVVIVGRRRSGVDLAEQLLDSVLAGNRFVVVKGDLGRALEAQAHPDLASEEAGGAGQRALGVAPALLVAEGGVVDARLLQIGADAHARQRHETDARVVDLASEQ